MPTTFSVQLTKDMLVEGRLRLNGARFSHDKWLGNRVVFKLGEYDREVTLDRSYGTDGDTISISSASSKGLLRVRAYLPDGRLDLVTVARNDIVNLVKFDGRWEFQTNFRRKDTLEIEEQNMAIRTLDNNGNPRITVDNPQPGQTLVWDENGQRFRNATRITGDIEVPALVNAADGQVLKVNVDRDGERSLEWDDEDAHPIITDFSMEWLPFINGVSHYPDLIVGPDENLGGQVIFRACFQNVGSIQYGLAAIRYRIKEFGEEWQDWVVEHRNIPATNILEITKTMRQLTARNGAKYQWQMTARDEHGNLYTSNVIQREVTPTSDQQNSMTKFALWGVQEDNVPEPFNENWTIVSNGVTEQDRRDVTDTDQSFEVVFRNVEIGQYYFIVTPLEREPTSIASQFGGESLNAFSRVKVANNMIVRWRRNTSDSALTITYSVITQ